MSDKQMGRKRADGTGSRRAEGQKPDPTQHPAHPQQRFLHDGPPTGRFQHGYTDEPKLAMRYEPEALDRDDWERHVAREAKQRKAALLAGQAREMRALSQEERLKEAKAHADSKRRDVSRESLACRRMIERGKIIQAERMLQKVERIARLGRAA